MTVLGCPLMTLAIALSGTSTTIRAQDSEAPEGIVNYTRVDATVACGGATPAAAMAGLKALGFVSVINFRSAEEEGADIEGSQAAAEAAGLKYIHIPFRAPSAEIVENFLSVIADTSNQPVYIHCASANRVGAMWFIKRVKQDGWDSARAMTEAETIGLRSERLKEFVTTYIAENR
ncbi:MAG: sulfur transferase domain-containing protein [Vicinamibacterales bacterium]|jgi:uncharacterized protein (TIGR01244 family)|nr:sulfur transferase domain-containing protein [Vicinamibacterales bacterium]